MKKTFICLSFILLTIRSFSQIGVLTETPQATLHVNGNVQVTKDINMGGNTDTRGSSGVLNNVLISQGIGKSPIWSSMLKIPSETLFMKASSQSKNYALTSAYNTLVFQDVLLLNREDANGQPLIVFTEEGRIKVSKNTDGVYDSFTVKEDGYYLIDLYIQHSVATSTSVNDIMSTMTSIISLLKGNVILTSETSNFLVNYPEISQNNTQAVYLNANDVVSFQFSLVSNVAINKPTSYKITYATVGVQYLGK